MALLPFGIAPAGTASIFGCAGANAKVTKEGSGASHGTVAAGIEASTPAGTASIVVCAGSQDRCDEVDELACWLVGQIVGHEIYIVYEIDATNRDRPEEEGDRILYIGACALKRRSLSSDM